jgi:hypothetical protein
MKRLLTLSAIVLILCGAAAPAGAMCNGTVHLPGCGASGNYC